MSVQSEITRISGNVTAALAAIADKGVIVPDGSTSDALAELIASIEAGGGGGGGTIGAVSSNDVNFYDYDGTLLYAYTLDEAHALTALPDGPTHSGLVFDGWNWALEKVQSLTRPMNIGAMYSTDDGTTRIYIHLDDGRTSPRLGICPNGTVTVDWGDGTEPNVLTGTSLTTLKWTPTHDYASPGDYAIRLTVDGTAQLRGLNSYEGYSYLLRYGTGKDKRNIVYQNAVQKVEIGDGIIIGDYAFAQFGSMSSISIPDSVTSIGNGAFYACETLNRITIPDNVTSISEYAFNFCYTLSSISIPDSVTSIGNYAFRYCYGIKYYDFTRHTAVPTLSNTNAFELIAKDCEIRVPAALADEWKAATNWATYANYIVGV